MLYCGRYMQRREVTIETAIESRQGHNSEHCNSEQPGCARNSIIDAGSDTSMALVYRAHNCCCERSDGDNHTNGHHDYGWEKGRPVATHTTSDLWQSKKGKADSCDDRSHHKRKLRTIAVN